MQPRARGRGLARGALGLVRRARGLLEPEAARRVQERVRVRVRKHVCRRVDSCVDSVAIYGAFVNKC